MDKLTIDKMKETDCILGSTKYISPFHGRNYSQTSQWLISVFLSFDRKCDRNKQKVGFF